MLDGDILATTMTRAGMKPPPVIERAQAIYCRTSPGLARKVCPGVRRILCRLQRRGIVTGLVTGNLTRIGWRKMDRAGLVGDHPNDVRAAKANGIRAVAVATGLITIEELKLHSPDVLLPDLRSLTLEMLF